MNENREGWERDVLRELATASIREQRRARRWGIFFKFMAFGYVKAVTTGRRPDPGENGTVRF